MRDSGKECVEAKGLPPAGCADVQNKPKPTNLASTEDKK